MLNKAWSQSHGNGFPSNLGRCRFPCVTGTGRYGSKGKKALRLVIRVIEEVISNDHIVIFQFREDGIPGGYSRSTQLGLGRRKRSSLG
jgi:hypothetical protein